MQVASLMRKFGTITVENQLLRQELNQVKQELNEVKKKNDHLQKANEDMQKMCGELKNGQNAVKADINEQKVIQKSKFDDLEIKCVSLQTHSTPLPVPPFYFSLSNVNST